MKKPIYKKWWFWVLIVIIIAAIGANLEEEQPTATAEPAPVPAAEPQSPPVERDAEDERPAEVESENRTISEVGGVVETKNFRVSVEDLRKPKGNDFNRPGEGKEFVQVVLLIENISDRDYSVSSVLMFDAYYDGFSITESLSAAIADDAYDTINGPLAAGKKLLGALSYELPVEWETLEVDVDLTTLRLSTDGKIKIILNNQ